MRLGHISIWAVGRFADDAAQMKREQTIVFDLVYDAQAAT